MKSTIQLFAFICLFRSKVRESRYISFALFKKQEKLEIRLNKVTNPFSPTALLLGRVEDHVE